MLGDIFYSRLLPLVSSLLVLSLYACGDGGGGGSGSGNTGAAGYDQGIASGGVSQAFTITTIAGFESPLVKLAHIDDQLPVDRHGNVETVFGGNLVFPSGGHTGLLYNCEGLAQRQNCDVYGTVIYNAPGIYPYTVTYRPSGLFSDPVTLTGSVVVKEPGNFVVVSIGDSVASGEGNPMLPVDALDGAYWNNLASNYAKVPGVNDGYDSLFVHPGCHRSAYAGPAQAAARLKQTNDVTFIHIACSGGLMRNVDPAKKATRWYEVGEIDEVQLQLDWVRERVPRIDVLVISAGANNVAGGFGSVVTKCLANNPFKPCSEDLEFRETLRTSIAGLGVEYGNLQSLIAGGDEPKVPSVVAITEYFDPTRDANGDFPGPAVSVSCGLGAISPKEWQFLYDEMVVPLNTQVRAAAELYGWVYVGGIADAFHTHGYCASPLLGDISGRSWVVKIPESLTKQGDAAGTAHPDGNGQLVYRDAIYTAVVRANPPRTVASATTEGRPYAFGTWVNTDVEVTLSVGNPIRESGVRDTYYAADEPRCDSESVAVGACLPYALPFTISESGRHVVSFFSNNQFGAPETRAKPVEVLIDKVPPVMTCSASPDTLWPPNKRMVDITVSVTSVDEVSGPADYWLTAIQDSQGEAATAVQGFQIGTADVNGSMLADRAGNLGERTYTLTYQSADALGNVASCDVVVRVPHDQRP
jgi:hypothetical protein